MLLALLLLLGLAGVPRPAWAVCWYTSGSATTVTFNAGTITLTPGTQIGQVLWTSNTANPANPPDLECDGNTNGGIVNTIAGQPTGDNTLFPTGIPGISYRLLHPNAGTLLAAYPNYPTGSGTFSVASNLQLVYTGPFLPPNNSTITGQLAQWKVDICDNPRLWWWGAYRDCNGSVAPRPVETFNVSAIIRIQVPTCNVAPASVNKTVALPDVMANQFSGQGSTAGTTPFTLQLTNCPSNLDVYITLDSTNAQAGVPGVIAPSGAGYASGIGVQILRSDGTTPVIFCSANCTPVNTGSTSAGNYAINFFARYFQTGTTISAGPVRAIATYTLNYQ